MLTEVAVHKFTYSKYTNLGRGSENSKLWPATYGLYFSPTASTVLDYTKLF